MQRNMKAMLCLGFAGAATAASNPRRDSIRFPFNMPKGHKPTGGFNFMANCYNFISAMSSTESNAHTLKCHADGELCNAWANALPDVIKAKHSGAASHNKALSYNHWCDAVRLAEDPKTMPVANFKAEQRKAQHVEHKVEQKAKVTLKAKVRQQEEAEHVKLSKQAQKLREHAEEAKAKASQAAQEAEEKKSVAEMMKELSTKAKRELEERAKKGHKEALVAKSVTDTSDSKYQELVNKLEHKATVEAPKATEAPKAERTIKHHGWDGVLATEDRMRAGDFVQKASSPTRSESRVGRVVEEIYEDVASLVHRVV